MIVIGFPAKSIKRAVIDVQLDAKLNWRYLKDEIVYSVARAIIYSEILPKECT